jgi:excisionase family DNA binding protein
MSNSATRLDPLLSLAEVWETLSISRAGLYRLIDRGELEIVEVGSRRLIEVAELRRFIAAGRRRRDDKTRHSKPGLVTTSAGDGGGDAAG